MNDSEHFEQLAAGTHRCQPGCPYFDVGKCWHCQRVEVERPALLCVDCLAFGEMAAAALGVNLGERPAERGQDGDQLYAQAAQYRTGPDRWRATDDQQRAELEAAERADDVTAEQLAALSSDVDLEADTSYMRMLDPDRPWLMGTSDGHWWIQCADCDTWVQAEQGMSFEAAQQLAEHHRRFAYPHLQPEHAPKARGNRAQRRMWAKLRGRK